LRFDRSIVLALALIASASAANEVVRNVELWAQANRMAKMKEAAMPKVFNY
jgi:hypothetical protein